MSSKPPTITLVLFIFWDLRLISLKFTNFLGVDAFLCFWWLRHENLNLDVALRLSAMRELGEGRGLGGGGFWEIGEGMKDVEEEEGSNNIMSCYGCGSRCGKVEKGVGKGRREMKREGMG